MKDFVFVEFLFEAAEYKQGYDLLENLGEDFQILGLRDEWDFTDDLGESYKRVNGKINSMTAAVIRLSHPELTKRMRISYISDELKNKYRR